MVLFMENTLIWYENSKNIKTDWFYVNGKKHGLGASIYVNGNKYVGEYKEDKEHGQGTFTFKNGTLEEGIWKDDKFQYKKKKPTSTSDSKIEGYKSFCSEIGFTPGTEKFGECVVEAMKKG